MLINNTGSAGPAFFHNFRDLRKTPDNAAVIIRLMGNRASRAVLDPAFCPAEIPAAVFSQRIQRTITEQAVEMFRIDALVAGEVFAFPVAEEFIMFHNLDYKSITAGPVDFLKKPTLCYNKHNLTEADADREKKGLPIHQTRF